MRRILPAFVLTGGIMAAGLTMGAEISRSAFAKGMDRYGDLDTLAQALHHIEARYLSETSTRSLIYGAIRGMTQSLDEHSAFLDPSMVEDVEIRTEGWFSGIGVEVRRIDNQATIGRVVPDSPADAAGVQRGDQLVQIDGQATGSAPLDVVSGQLRGDIGSSVQIQVRRGEQTLQWSIERARIRDKTVRVDPIGNGWVLAEIVRFQRNTASDLSRGLRKASKAGLRGIILDLRDNPGGLLDEAVDVVELFLDEGLIVETRGRGEVVVEHHEATEKSPFGAVPLVILINGGSASASEIVAGTLQAHGRAKLVGSASYGKWSVQRMYVFEDGSALKLTVARYHLAEDSDGTTGLSPDILVSRVRSTEAQAKALRGLVATLAPDARQEALDLIDELTDGPSKPPPIFGTIAERLTLDPQLEAAWKTAHAKP